MKIKSKITALLTLILMLFAQMPFSAFAAETTTDIRADLLSPDTLPDGRVEVKYNAEFCFDYSNFYDGFNQYSWHIIDGELPPGLTLYPTGGPTWEPWINGTPTKAGTYTFTIQGGVTHYKNGENVYITAAKKTYSLTILPAYPLEIENYALYHGNENDSYNVTFYEDRNRTVTWSIALEDGGALPEGLSIDETSGELNWENPIAGKYNLKITATRDDESVSKVLRLIIEPGSGYTHTNTTKTERKHATCKENGLADYWYCDTCEQYFLDAECTRQTSSDGLDNLYTIGFHSDKIGNDGKCDTCGKTMPIFKKVTNEDEITSGGMYLVVSKINDKYYTLKAPEKDYVHGIEATEITQNTDGTFSYPESDTDVMILKTEFAAECGTLDAGKPRYSLGTTINGIPYSISSDDYSGSIYTYSYENNKYGYRMSLLEDGTPAIASVYAEYWGGESGKGGSSGILTAFVGTKTGETERFFSLRTKDSYENDGIYTGYGYEYYDENSLSTYPIELYKLTYAGAVGSQNYTLSDAQSMVTIGSECTVVNSVEGKGCSTVGGISEAVKTSYIEKVISEQSITGDISVTAYADISLKNEDSTTNDYGYTSINSLVYQITPKIEIKGKDSEESATLDIDDKYFDGSEMTVSLCVGNMEPQQIIHYKTDGTKEYFYDEHSKKAKSGAKSFSNDPNYNGKGNFVTFTIDSFSNIEILATAKEEPITVGNATVNVPVAGETPSFTAVSDDPSRYTVELLKWIDIERNMDFSVADLSNVNSYYYNYKFEAGKQYEVMVRFTAADGYELSYNNNFTINGEKTWWRGDGLIRTYTFVPSTNTAVNGNIFTVTGNNIDGFTVVLALYKTDSRGNSRLADCQSAEYNGEAITFTTTATDYTSAKVMVWNNLTTIKPVTEVEIVNLGNS